MFDENFSFSSFSRSPSSCADSEPSPTTREPSRSVSPCSPMSAFPAPHGYSVTDLAADLDRQRIRPDARISYQCDSYANTTDDDSAWALPPMSDDSEGDSAYSGSISTIKSCSITSSSRSRTAPARSYSPISRSQRQSNTRMLVASQHHAKDIAELVSRMVSSSDQCAVIAPPDSLPRNMASDEEADDEGYTSAGATSDSAPSSRRGTIAKREFECRRAYDSRRTARGSAAIAKDIRFRRHRTSCEKNSVA
jgi:hypothetical protein